MAESTAEVWRPVEGTGGKYEVSDQGRVMSHARGRTKILSAANHGAGYRSVRIFYTDGTNRTKLVHHLVLEAFVGPRPDGMESLHANDDHADNRAENLRWGTKAENVVDKILNGMTGHGGAGKHLKPDQVRMVRARIAEGRGLKAIALEFGIRPCSVWEIKVGRSWADVA